MQDWTSTFKKCIATLALTVYRDCRKSNIAELGKLGLDHLMLSVLNFTWIANQASRSVVCSVMADFSQFGGVSDDWTAYVTTHPQPPLPPDLTPVQLQERTNAGREANSREILKTITSKF